MNEYQFVTKLLTTVSRNIKSSSIKRKTFILIAVSGGQDSICVFFIFIQLKKQWQWAFGIVYCNHLWQKNAFYTGTLILKIAYLFNIPIYYCTTCNTLFNEKNSRNWRYKIFSRISFFYDYLIIFIGHTLNDKIETMLFQLIRGTSPENLICLNTVKNLSSITKFTKNLKIKNTFFYNKKNTHLKKAHLFHWQQTLLFNDTETRQRKLFILKRKKIYNNPVKFETIQPYLLNIYTKNSKANIFFHRNYQKILHINIKKNNLLNTNVFSKKNSLNTWSICKTPTFIYFCTITSQFTLKHQAKKFIIKNKKTQYTNFIVSRPIIILTRFDLKKLLLFFNLPIYPDTTNQKKMYYRNRIRKQLLPTLKYFFNPKIENNVIQFSEILSYDQYHLKLLFKRLMHEFYICHTLKFTFNFNFIFYVPVSFQRKLVKQFLEDCTNTPIRLSSIDKILCLLQKTQTLTKNSDNNLSLNISNYLIFLFSYQKPNFDKQNYKEIYNTNNVPLSIKAQKIQNTFNFQKLTQNKYSSAKLLLNKQVLHPKSFKDLHLFFFFNICYFSKITIIFYSNVGTFFIIKKKITIFH